MFHHFTYNSNWQREVRVTWTEHGPKSEFARYRNFSSMGLSFPQFSFRPLFELIEPRQVIQLVTHLLLEHKVLLVRSKYQDNAILIESLLQLLAPLYPQIPAHKACSQWTFVNISYITRSMSEYVDMPMPYVMGVPRMIYDQICKERGELHLSDDTVLFDVDKKELRFTGDTYDLPTSLTYSVFEALTNARMPPGDKTNPVFSPEEHWLEGALKVRLALFEMYLSLLDNFAPFLATHAEEPLTAGNVFQMDKYLACFQDERAPFMMQFARTQNFSSFLEHAYRSRTETNEITYFMEGAKVFHTLGHIGLAMHSKKTLVQMQRIYRNVTSDFILSP